MCIRDRVAACAETVRNGKTTWAYQLTSGDWVLAYNVQELSLIHI